MTVADLDRRLADALAPHLVLVRLLGAGGMGSVFEARDPALRRSVAVKVLAPDLAADPSARARFEREAQAVAGLSHPNVVPVYTVGELADGTPYFVMQHVTGRSLAERIDQGGPLPMAEARRIIGEVAGALAAAHAKGIIHRDIKPANILLDDESGRALVTDFGIAAVLPGAERSDSRITQTGMIVGTPAYMSPEQLLNEPVTDRTDVYALGLLAYEMLTGRAVFEASTPQELIAAHLRDAPKPLDAHRDDVDAEVASLVARCLDKDPGRRPSAEEVGKRLAPGGGVLLEWPPPGLEPVRGVLRRLALGFGAGSALLLAAMLPALVGGIAGRIASPAASLQLVAGLAGVTVLIIAGRLAVHAGLSMTRVVRAGFAWTTILETAADARGDTGALIAGASSYAALAPVQRSDLRRARVAREALLLVGGLLPLPLAMLILAGGAAGWASPPMLWAAPLAGVFCIACASALAMTERRAAAPRRAGPRKKTTPDLARLSAAWYPAFEAVRRDQSLGRGATRPAAAGWIAGVLLAAVTVPIMVTVGTIMAVGIIGPVFWVRTNAPEYVMQKVRRAEPMRSFALPRDGAVSPEAAGRAWFSLAEDRNPNSTLFPEHDVPRAALPPWATGEEMPAALFAGYHATIGKAYPAPAVIDSARRGFTAAEMAWLERLSRQPAWRTYDTIARAPLVDFVAGRFVLPFRRNAEPIAMPVTRLTQTRAYAMANAGRMAWHLARRQADSAEYAARQVASVGFQLMDYGNSVIDVVEGSGMVTIARDDLLRLYRITGNPKGARLQSLINANAAAEDTRPSSEGPPSSLPDTRRRLVAMLRDTTIVRAARLQLLLGVRFAYCSSARELFFGLSPDYRDAVDEVRRQLARVPSDSATIDMLTRSAVEPDFEDAGLDVLRWSIIWSARFAGALVHNDRIPGCAWLLLMLSNSV